MILVGAIFYYQVQVHHLNRQLKSESVNLKHLQTKTFGLAKNLPPDFGQKIKVLSKVHEDRLPIEEILYKLNLIDVPSLYLVKLEIRRQKLIIEGEIIKSRIYPDFSSFISRIEQIRYVGNVHFSINSSPSGYAPFVIETEFKK
ncbi:MAG: hypothetical protein HRT90_11965 [Candidatus Margulisbacteria bacterium]|nr:hypothetical protein [Candidatus Margulisiibacteriota bacterium]